MKLETLEEAADRWVFETNGHKWSNNDDTAGDNFGSFKAGAEWQAKRLYSEEEVIELLQKALTHKDDRETGSLVTAQGEIRPANFFSWFERFKKK